jgi:hypothetical protein
MIVLMLGDSVAERVSKHDTDKRTLGSMLYDKLGDGLHCVTGSGYHMGVYLERVRGAEGYDIVILPISLRSFAPPWYLNPLWSYDGQTRDVKEYLYSQVDYPLSKLKTIHDFAAVIKDRPSTEAGIRARLREIFVFHYCHPLLPDHPRLAQLRELLAVAEEKGISVFAYIVSVNHHAGLEYVGEEFFTTAKGNIAVVRDVFTDTKATLMNLWGAMPRSHFFHADEAAEHLSQSGRQVLAHILEAGVKQVQNSRREDAVYA